jgi:hypothetical protein
MMELFSPFIPCSARNKQNCGRNKPLGRQKRPIEHAETLIPERLCGQTIGCSALIGVAGNVGSDPLAAGE